MIREFRYWDGNASNQSADENSDENDSDGGVDEHEDDRQRLPRRRINRRNKNKKQQQNNSVLNVSQEIQCGLNRLRIENPENCDITLIAGDYKILAHRLILSSCSSYFNAMFSGVFTEKNDKEIVLNDLDNEMINILIDYMYTGSLPFKSDNVQRIYLMARFLQIDSAQEICCNYLKNNINLKNCLELLEWAANNSVSSICDELIKFVAKNFSQLYIKNEFLSIDVEDLKKLLVEKSVINMPEETLFSIIIRWINKNKKERIQHLDSLLNKINAQHLPHQLFSSTTLKDILPEHNLAKWISKNEPFDINDINNWDIILFRRTGNFPAQLIKPNIESTADIASLPNNKEIFDGGFINYGSTIYHQGGCTSKRRVTNETFCYNLYKNKWTEFVKLKVPRAYNRNCILNGCLYTFGGSDGYRALHSVESIDLISGHQMILPNMLNARESMGVTCLKNSIYVVGGRNRGLCEYYSCEHYDPRIGKWELLNSSPKLLGITSAATINDNSIYCVNGKIIDNCGLNRYDILTNKWTSIYTNYFRYPSELFEMNNSLYGVFKDHLANYEIDKGKWKIINQLGYHHDYLTALPLLIAPHQQNHNDDNQNIDNNHNIN